MSSNQETPASKFDALYQNAAKVFAAQSLAERFNSAPEKLTSKVEYSAESECLTYSSPDLSGDEWKVSMTSSNGWMPNSNVVNTTGYVYPVETYYYDWYDWWKSQFLYKHDYYYQWPDFTKVEIKKILEEIRDSIKPATNKLSKDLVSDGWPPSDVSVNEDGGLVIEVALAGYCKSMIEAAFAGDKLVVKFKDSKKAANTSPIQSGIKRGDGSIEFFVDPAKFDAEGTKVTFENGVLCICVPTVAKQTKKLDIL